MKKLLFIAMCFVSLNLSAQGNLQFNQVVSSDFSGSYINRFTAGSITVPPDKVWKVEHAGFMNYFNSPPVPANGNLDHVAIGNHLVYVPTGTGSADLPLWLGPGTYSVTGYLNTGSSQPCQISISVIEFNVVP